MSSGATPLSRKRTHSLERGVERSIADINAKKPRISSEAPSSRAGKKRRTKKRRAVPAVEDISESSSARGHHNGAELMSPQVQYRGGHRGKQRRVVESDDEEDTNIAPWPTPYSQVIQKSQTNGGSTSSSPSLKGKEREVEPAPFVSALDAEDLSRKTEDLNQKLDVQTTKLAIHSALISSFKDSLTCQICVDLMYKPFTLAPCGHIACYSCLVGWFKSNAAEDEFGPQSVHRKKTCPHCRSAVHDRPIENFTIKEMVNSLVNSGALEDVSGEPAATSAALATPADPWAGIFPKQPVRENNYDGLPFAMFDEEDGDHDYEEGDLGIYDEEDDVYRCRGCMNEVVDGFCTQCDREYQPAWTAGPLLGAFLGGHGDGLWGDDTDSDSDGGSGYSQENYDNSFIDDDMGLHVDPGSDIDPIPLPPFREDDDDDDDDDEVIVVGTLAAPRQRIRQATIVISSDEEDDGNYTDADTNGDRSQSWNEEEDEGVDYHDARSDSDDRDGYNYYGTDGEPYGGSDNGVYGYL